MATHEQNMSITQKNLLNGKLKKVRRQITNDTRKMDILTCMNVYEAIDKARQVILNIK